MPSSYLRIAHVWRGLLYVVQSSRTVQRLFWRLPYATRRRMVLILGIEHFVPASLLVEVLKRKVLFIHVPKTAGISIQQTLFGCRYFGHEMYRQYELALDREQLAPLFKFTFVRNPWDRLVSAWTYLREGGYNQADKDWFAARARSFPDFESFVLGWLARTDVDGAYFHFRPQVRYLENGHGRLEMNFVGRFERLAEDFAHVAQIFGCSAPLQNHNRTQSRTPVYRDYYTARSARAVAQVYREDIRAFGYDF